MKLTKQGIAARERPRHSRAQQNILILMHQGYVLTERRGIMNLATQTHMHIGRVTYPSVENLKGLGLITLLVIDEDGETTKKTYGLTDAGRAAAQQGSNYYRK